MQYPASSISRVLVTIFLSLISVISSAQEKNTISLDGGWLRMPPPGRNITSGYFSLQNRSGQTVRLVRVDVENCRAIELHESFFENDIVGMRELPRGISVEANKTVMLQPGGLHLMCIGLDGQFEVGITKSITLFFDNILPSTHSIEVRRTPPSDTLSRSENSPEASILPEPEIPAHP